MTDSVFQYRGCEYFKASLKSLHNQCSTVYQTSRASSDKDGCGVVGTRFSQVDSRIELGRTVLGRGKEEGGFVHRYNRNHNE